MKTTRHGAGLSPKGRDPAERKYSRLRERRRPSRVLTVREARRRVLTWLLPRLTASLPKRRFSSSLLRRVANLILRAASRHSSVARARAQFRRGPSERHAQRVLEHLVRRKTQRVLTRALREQDRPYLPPHPVDVADDFHETPYYGEAIDPKHPQFGKTKEERGTHRAYRYVTLDIVHRGFRFTVAAHYLDHRVRLDEALRAALHGAERVGVQIGRLYLAVALMLENEWTVLRLLYTSEGRQGPGGLTLREELLRFETLLDLLFLGVGRVLGTVREVGNRKPPPRRLRRWGMVRP